VRHHVRPEGSPPTNGYSHAVTFTGPMVVVSGQVPLDSSGQLVGHGDAAEQTRQVFRNLETALAAAGATMADVVKLTIYLTDLTDLPAFRAARDEFVDPARPPASSLVQVAGLVHPGFRVEVDAIAAIRN
jgi:reactive intermediate/imine deaminase